ncbi:Alkyldihydroxyacetonephosphate synthase, peroxisomal, partial [Armadillidium vulgare]
MDPSQRRLETIKNHLHSPENKDVIYSESSVSEKEEKIVTKPRETNMVNNHCFKSKQYNKHSNNYNFERVKSFLPRKRQELLKWNGWGYNDSKFVVHRGKDYYATFTGDRYKIGGDIVLPYFASWVIETLGVNFWEFNSARPPFSPSEYPEPIINEDFFHMLLELKIPYSVSGEDRLFRSHENHDDVERIVQLAEQNNCVVIPFGGGTSVTLALLCPETETRMIISLDTSQMNQILWVDEINLTARIQSGIFGQDLEAELGKRGYTMGHEPDSYEFSSLGGWVATRASGMKKNIYGNIEDIVVQNEGGNTPRNRILGVITEVTVKIRPVPEVRRYGSLVFEDFEKGIACLREVAYHRCQPASIRLLDNEQFKFGHALKPPSTLFGLLSDGIKKIYLTKIKGFNLNEMCVATLLFEGKESDVNVQEKKIYEISQRYGGIPAGESNGERGYMLTFVIAYIRDVAFDYSVVAESFETSVPWDKVDHLCHNVKHRIRQECKARDIKYHFVTCRVTQTYDAGACTSAREEIIGCGGNISHHHGVGKVRREWMAKTVSNTSMGALKALKEYFDPKCA